MDRVWVSLLLLTSLVLFLEFGRLVRLIRVCRLNQIPCSRSFLLAGVFLGLALTILAQASHDLTQRFRDSTRGVESVATVAGVQEEPSFGGSSAGTRQDLAAEKRTFDHPSRQGVGPSSLPQFSAEPISDETTPPTAPVGGGGQRSPVLQARVERVIDGDSLVLQSGVRVVLGGVNTPELAREGSYSDPIAEAAYAFSRDVVEGAQVVLEVDPRGTDRYGRLVAYVWRDGTLLNRALVLEGLAEVLPRLTAPSYRRMLAMAEAAARRAHRGIWEGGPWPIVGNRASLIYHVPGDAFYFKVSAKNRVFFPSEEAAEAANFRRAYF